MKTIIPIILMIMSSSVYAGAINLSWNDNSDNEKGFNIEVSEDNGQTFEQVFQVGENISQYTFNVSDEDRDTVYTFRVNAYNDNGVSGYTNTVSASVKSLSVPQDPSNPSLKIELITINAETVILNEN